MTISNIVQNRLCNQQVYRPVFKQPGEVVSWLGAVQAQDYLGSLWAIGLRMQNTTEKIVEQAVANRSIIRTWALRCTWHFMTAADVRWILELVKPRLVQMYAAYYRKLELDKTTLAKSHNILARALQDGKQLTRKELKTALQKKGISTEGLRVNFLLLRAAQDGLICHGPRRGKEFTFVLLDEWVPATKKIKRDEALAELARRYFTSHGPATLNDFSWWSGLTTADARKGLEMINSDLRQEIIDRQTYWMADNIAFGKTNPQGTYLLPPFDEYLVAYKDRNAALKAAPAKKILGPGSGIFSPVIVSNGYVTGTWKRIFTKNAVMIETKPFITLNKSTNSAIASAARHYGNFVNMPVELHG